MEKNVILVTQARSGSTRLPRKVLKKIGGKSLLQIHLERIKSCLNISEIIVATTTNIEDDEIYNKVINWGFTAYRGSENDVLDRFYQSVKDKKPDFIVRVTSDCPLIDSDLIDKVIKYSIQNDVDYCSNTLVENYPDGQDVAVFKFLALKTAWENAKLQSEREHVTPYIKKNSSFNGGTLFLSKNYQCQHDFSSIRMTVDEISDFELISKIINDLGTNKSWLEYTNYIINNKLNNDDIIRNEGYLNSLKNDKKVI
jgi:spore coat polysaccharide biosynthesis protein SpsF (cytidylyltransferase family)